MINPTAVDILRTVDATIVNQIEPSLSDISGRSAMATVRHLLRHVMVRIETEGQLLTDDIAALRRLLAETRDYLATPGADHEGAALSAKIDSVLTGSPRDPALYPNLTMLASEAGALRACLFDALKHLQAIRGARRDDSAYASLRAAIRGYLVTQIEQEEAIIGPAFFGRGPRR